MTSTRDLFDFEQEALAAFDSAIKQSRAAEEVNREVARLEGKLEQLHNVAVMTARRADKIEEVAAIWKAMLEISGHVAEKIHALVAANPGCSIYCRIGRRC